MPKLEQFFKKAELIGTTLSGIDRIYLINLDQRPEKLREILEQLSPFAIHPRRLSAIHGWSLQPEELQEIGLTYGFGMDGGEGKIYKPCLYPQVMRNLPLDPTCYGKACFHPRLSLGAIGCTLSHLSILQEALDANCETIWILEDDARVRKNLHLLSERISELDNLTNGEWDVLYTDDRSHFDPFTPGTVWRPDLPNLFYEPLYQYTPLGEHFMKIGGRCQTHSMIVRRSGMQKIVDFETQRGIFMPYDVEISFVPGIRLYNVKQEIVWGEIGVSDTDVNYFKRG